MRMGLQDGGARSNDFSPLAPAVCSRLQRAQATRWRRPILGLWQGTLTGRLAHPIDVENEEVAPLSVPQSTTRYWSSVLLTKRI